MYVYVIHVVMPLFMCLYEEVIHELYRVNIGVGRGGGGGGGGAGGGCRAKGGAAPPQ